MDIDLPDLNNRPRPDLGQPRTYSGLPFANPIDSAIPSEPVDITEQDVQDAEDEGDEAVEEVVEAPEEEGLTEAASAPDFEEQEDEDETPQAEAKRKRKKKKRKGL